MFLIQPIFHLLKDGGTTKRQSFSDLDVCCEPATHDQKDCCSPEGPDNQLLRT